jgi:predicted amidohydrolase YtcJ
MVHWSRIICTLASLGTLLGTSPLLATDCAGADLIVLHAQIVTMNPAQPAASALAVRDERIVAVGDDNVVKRCTDEHTETVDARGKTVLPGLIDVHAHAMLWAEGLLRNELDVSDSSVKSIPDIQRAVRERVARSSPGAWIRGSGWDDAKLAEHRYITRQDLDALSPNHPVYLEHVTGHLGTANSAALKLAGIGRDTPNPAGGVIEHDAAGELTGIVKDNAMRIVAGAIPPETTEFFAHAAAFATQRAAESGLTTIHDIWDGVRTFEREMRGYQQAYQQHQLKIRVQMGPGVASLQDAEDLVKIGVHTGFGDSHLKFGAVKMFADGGMGARTAAIYPPPPEGEPGTNLGLLIWKPEELQKTQQLLTAAGWQIATHAIGDRAINEVLDGYAATTNNLQLKDPRFRVIHCGISTPEVLRRLQQGHVLVDADPAFVYWIGSYFARYGAERARWAYPAKSYFDRGIVAGAGSDVPVTPISPWWGMWATVVRQEVESGAILAPEERISAQQALEMYTRNGAYLGFEEHDKGSLEVSKLADFILLDRNPLTVPVSEIKDTQVLATYVGGQVVYRNPNPSSSGRKN